MLRISCSPSNGPRPCSHIWLLVVKTLSVEASVLHIGMIIDGLPRMKSVTKANLMEAEGGAPTGIFSHVTVEDQPAVIPDLDKLALSIEKAVYTH